MNKRVPLPEGTTLGKSHEYGGDVNIGTREAKIWQPVRRMFGFNPAPQPVSTNAATYDDESTPNNSITAQGINHAFTTQVNRSKTTGEYLPEIEALLARTGPDATDADAEIEFRWYHKPSKGTPNPNDAGQGDFTVTYSRANTGPDGSIEAFAWTLTGVGTYEKIENPFGGWDGDAPTITSATPSGAAAGAQVEITGTGFQTVDGTDRVTGAAGVKFGSTNAASYLVVSPTKIVAVLPAGSAGSAPIIVTNGDGASSPKPYTRGA